MYRNDPHFFSSTLPNIRCRCVVFLIGIYTPLLIKVWKCGREEVGVKFISIHFTFTFYNLLQLFACKIKPGPHFSTSTLPNRCC
jgi:hypothetical protein